MIERPGECGQAHAVADFSLFGTFNQKHPNRLPLQNGLPLRREKFQQMDITEGFAKTENGTKEILILEGMILRIEEAKEFCEYHHAELPKSLLSFPGAVSPISLPFWVKYLRFISIINDMF